MGAIRIIAIGALAVGGAALLSSCGSSKKTSWDNVPVGNNDNLYPNEEDCYKCHSNRDKFTQTESEHRQGIVGTCLNCHSQRGLFYGRSKIDNCESCHDMGEKYHDELGGKLSCTMCHIPTGDKRHPGPPQSYLAYHVLKPKVYGARPEVKVFLNPQMLDLSLTCKTCHHSEEDKKRRAGRPELEKYPSGCGHSACHATSQITGQENTP